MRWPDLTDRLLASYNVVLSGWFVGLLIVEMGGENVLFQVSKNINTILFLGSFDIYVNVLPSEVLVKMANRAAGHAETIRPRSKFEEHGDFITFGELGAADTVGPDDMRQYIFIHHFKAESCKKIGAVGQDKDPFQS